MKKVLADILFFKPVYFSMTGLILSTNLIQFYIFWNWWFLAIYLLIGFTIKIQIPKRAARKAFLINRIGDFALFSAILGFTYFCNPRQRKYNLSAFKPE